VWHLLPGSFSTALLTPLAEDVLQAIEIQVASFGDTPLYNEDVDHEPRLRQWRHSVRRNYQSFSKIFASHTTQCPRNLSAQEP
jgi:hypothetical protein